MKRFIITKNEFNSQQFCLYDGEGYGMYTWGSTSQRRICYDKKLNKPYINTWKWGGRFEDDYTEREYLDIVDEFDTIACMYANDINMEEIYGCMALIIYNIELYGLIIDVAVKLPKEYINVSFNSSPDFK